MKRDNENCPFLIIFFRKEYEVVRMDFYQDDEKNLFRRLMNWAVDIILVISVAWFTVYMFGTEVKIAGNSMTPALESGDTVLMNRLPCALFGPGRFDLVAFEREDRKTNVKRVIGLPGETVQIKGGLVYINGQPLEAENGLEQVALAGLAENPITLGKDEYFLLGDNRESSEDSRFINIGNVKREQIKGSVWIRILPVIRFGLID